MLVNVDVNKLKQDLKVNSVKYLRFISSFLPFQSEAEHSGNRKAMVEAVFEVAKSYAPADSNVLVSFIGSMSIK